jgi:hypothetical protein
MQVGYLKDILRFILFYSPCYKRLFENKKKKKTEIELSSEDENDVKPKPEEMEPCCSSSLKD